MIKQCLLIEITQCLLLEPIGSLLTTWVCFEPEPPWEEGFPEIMAQSLSRSIDKVKTHFSLVLFDKDITVITKY